MQDSSLPLPLSLASTSLAETRLKRVQPRRELPDILMSGVINTDADREEEEEGEGWTR